MITLVLGGTRSGKSEIAEGLAARTGVPVTYVATATAADADMAARITAHRARRPRDWTTLEVASGGELAAMLSPLAGTALIDSVGAWLAGSPGFRVDASALCRALLDRRGDSIVVSEEVGLGVHSSTEVGRRFADALGELNRAVADAADRVLLVVAGRVLPLDAVGSARLEPDMVGGTTAKGVAGDTRVRAAPTNAAEGASGARDPWPPSRGDR